MRRTVFPPNAQDQRVLPLPCSISLQKFLEFPFTDAISAKVSTGSFPVQKRGSSRPCKSIPGTLTILEWVTRSCMSSITGTAAGLGTFSLCPHKRTPHVACGMSGRGQGGAKWCMTIRKTPPSVMDYQEPGHGHWGWEEKHQSPLCSSQKNPHLITNYGLWVTDGSQQALQDDPWALRTFQEEVTNMPKGGTMCSGCTVGWLLQLNFNTTFKNNFSVNHNVCE